MGRTLIMSDVNWRDINEDRSLFEKENWDREILVKTTKDILRETKARYVYYTHYMKCCEEFVKLYAYLED